MTDIIELAKASGADVINAGESLDQRYEGIQTTTEHYLFTGNELTKFAQLLQQGEAVACKKCPNNKDVVCGYCEGSGFSEFEDGFHPCPQGCKPPTEATVFNIKNDKLYSRYVSYISSSTPIQVGARLFTTPPDTQRKLDKAREALQFYAWVIDDDLKHSTINCGTPFDIAQQALKETE